MLKYFAVSWRADVITSTRQSKVYFPRDKRKVTGLGIGETRTSARKRVEPWGKLALIVGVEVLAENSAPLVVTDAVAPYNCAAPKPRLPHAFTRENAREMQRRGAAAKAAQLEARRQHEIALTLNELDFRQSQLARTRAHIEMLNEKLSRAKEAKDLQFIATALSKLHDIEAKLRGPAQPERGGKSKSSLSEPLD